jgi:dienelactone hydrolase
VAPFSLPLSNALAQVLFKTNGAPEGILTSGLLPSEGTDRRLLGVGCAELAKRQQPGMVTFVAYPGAAHGFDLAEFGAGEKVMGMWLAYDRNAAQQSWKELRAFLEHCMIFCFRILSR